MSFPDNLPLESVLSSIADGVFTVDMDWTITYFNEAASRITGVPVNEAVGAKCWEVLHSSLCDGDCVMRRSLEEGRSFSNKSLFIVNSKGQKVPISISASPVRGEDGQLLGGVETFRDLSELYIMRREMQESYRFEDIVGKSPALEKIFSILPQVAKSEATVLVLGDSGTGKELFAKALHNLSTRSNGPFVAVNCGALPENLLESELFGYKAGAFTDARHDKPGRFFLARGGTIFLDEIGDLPPKLQVKLLRVLQERTYEPLGGTTPIRADVRVIAATNRNLEELVASGEFRQDLFYRLNVVTLRLPDIKQRRQDIPLLINHFVQRLNALQDKRIEGVSETAMQTLLRHDYPGNVRELENILEYAFILCPEGFIHTEHLPDYLQPGQRSLGSDECMGTLDEIKCRAVHAALERNNGRKMATCRELGISKDTLRRMLARCPEPGK